MAKIDCNFEKVFFIGTCAPIFHFIDKDNKYMFYIDLHVYNIYLIPGLINYSSRSTPQDIRSIPMIIRGKAVVFIKDGGHGT